MRSQHGLRCNVNGRSPLEATTVYWLFFSAKPYGRGTTNPAPRAIGNRTSSAAKTVGDGNAHAAMTNPGYFR
jgi:hypothetical protein